METFYTQKEISEILGVEYSTVGTWLRTGELPGIKAGKAWRIKGSDFKKYIENQKQEISEEAERKILYEISQWVSQPVIEKKSMTVSNNKHAIMTMMYLTQDHKFFYSEGKLYRLSDEKIIEQVRDIKE